MEQTVHYKFRVIALMLAVLTIVAIVFVYLEAKEQMAANTPEEQPIETPIIPLPEDPIVLPDKFALPEGFVMDGFATGLIDPRDMLFDEKGQLIVSQYTDGSIVVLSDDNEDDVVDRNTEILFDLGKPSGIALYCGVAGCWLYVAHDGAIWRYVYDAEVPRAFRGEEMAILSEGGLHEYHALLLSGEDIYASIGSSCDVCIESDPIRATIVKTDIDGDIAREYARGLRNVNDIALDAHTGSLFVIDDGRDGIDRELPPDELNLLEEGNDYGWPICFGNNQHDRFFDNNNYMRNPCEEPFQTSSYVDLSAHATPVSLAFIPERGWPVDYRGDILIATAGDEEYGTNLSGILRVDEVYGTSSVLDFASGWSLYASASGTPSQLLFDDEGVLYVSDKTTGGIYRLWYDDVIPDQVEATSTPVIDPIGKCEPTGCSGEICSDQPLDSACIYLPEYACLKKAVCERQQSGECGWTHTNDFQSCLDEVKDME